MSEPMKFKEVREAMGVVDNAPFPGLEGFGFVKLEDGTSVYVPRPLAKNLGLTTDDLGRRVKVRYTLRKPNRIVAIGLHLHTMEAQLEPVAEAVLDASECLDALVDVFANADEYPRLVPFWQARSALATTLRELDALGARVYEEK